jgi:hypothetical protein
MPRKTRTRRVKRARRATRRVKRGRRVRGGFTFPNMNLESIKERVKQEVENAKQEINMARSKVTEIASQAKATLTDLKNNYQSAVANVNANANAYQQ